MKKALLIFSPTLRAGWLVCWLLSLLAAQPGWAQELSAASKPQCYTRTDAPPSAARVDGCGSNEDYMPQPNDPIRTIRLMIHVFQRADGTGNWQDLPADRRILSGLINGLTHYPAANQSVPGVNGIYAATSLRQQHNGAGNCVVVPNAVSYDTRIRVQLVDIRFHRDNRIWDMSSATNGQGCPDGMCEQQIFDQYVTSPFDREHVIHVFMGENPGGASSTIDRFGNSTGRYGIGGRAQGIGAKNWFVMRGSYWAYYHHPNWAAGGVLNNANALRAFDYLQFLLAHELGHNLGLMHEDNGGGCAIYPEGKSNNLMNYPGCDGYSLTPCQIGLIYKNLRDGLAGLDDLVAEPPCELAAPGDVVVTGPEEWRGPRSLKGNLYVEAGAELRISCRAEFMAPQARIVVREGGELIIDGGTLAGVGPVHYRCNDPLELLLGGDPTKPADADNRGLIRITNRGATFEGENLLVQLTPQASLRLDATELTLDRATVITQPGSYLCVDPAALINPGTKGRFVVEPGTDLKLNPVIQQAYGACLAEPCLLFQRQFSFLNPFQPVNSREPCSQQLPLRVLYPAGLNVHYAWRRNGVAFGPDAPETQDTPPLTTRQVVSYEVDISVDGCPPFTLSRSGYLLPPAPVTLSNNTVDVCSGLDYYDLRQLNSRLNAGTNSRITWLDPDPRGSTLGSSLLTPGPNDFVPAKALAQGRRQAVLKMLYQDQSGQVCDKTFDFIVNVVDGPPVSAGPDKTVCAGQAVTLTATGSATGYVWTPGNLQGASITVTPTATTTYTVRTLGNPGDCASTDQVQVTLTPPDCAPCRPELNPLPGPVYTANPFVPGKSYHVTQNVRFELGTFTIPENTTVYCDPGVTLTVGYLARLELLGGRITAPCSGSMWGGLVVQPDSRGLLVDKGPGGERPEISHSYDGVRLGTELGAAPAVQLENADFRHNRTSLTLTSPAQGPALSGYVRSCTFDSDPQLLLAPMLATAANPQWSYRHILAEGPLSGVDISDNQLRNALVGLWKTGPGTLTLNNNEWRHCYIAGIYAQDALGSCTLSNNRFYFYHGSAQQPNIYAGAYLYDAYATLPESPLLLRPGAAYGFLGHSVGALSFDDNLFRGSATAPTVASLESNQLNPKVGIYLLNGTGHVRRSTFVNLYQGYVGPADQDRAEIRGNLFENCRTGIRFRNSPQGGPAGVAEVTCNTFLRTVFAFDSKYTYGIVRDFCAGPGYPCNQIDIRDLQSTTQLRYELRNEFIPENNSTNSSFDFLHIYNDPVNPSMDYCTTNDYVTYNKVKTSGAVAVIGPTLNGGRQSCSILYQTGLRPISTNAQEKTSTTVFLAQNVPNPFDQETRIAYFVPASTRHAELQVRDNLSGKILRTVALDAQQREVVLRLHGLLSGVYHYQLIVDGVPRAHRRLVLAY
ncbi:hypothetical protein EJV47_16780 [Hymenobacter gummosus]|uniref:T9SS type A sorting domain-containing protein n=1 Tax=Hymenobacter gummosus TaxID=1776032 RepID=A0A3S0H7T5_9BACT|nr:hypothetical protein [Hymenobacter gummosus]RTQ48094.1 hypothetical protein EJV47_16780 [Hymenobacter gummosus]